MRKLVDDFKMTPRTAKPNQVIHPSLPGLGIFEFSVSKPAPGIAKKIASIIPSTTMDRQSRVGRDVLQAIVEVVDQYFEQLGGDLEAFAIHTGKKRIIESNIMAVVNGKVSNIFHERPSVS